MLTTDHLGASVLLKTWVACGLRDVVVSPGSRNAPLVIAAHAHPEVRLVTALDERSAAHMALGMALSTRRPAAVVSTSGTAAINHGPALAEAYFSSVPLLSVTADRPVAARPSGPGQFVYQTDLFAAHTVLSIEVDESTQGASDVEQRALAAWMASAKGPVHVNVPFMEPLYGEADMTPASFTIPSAEDKQMPMPEGLLDALSCHDPRVLMHVGALREGQLDADGVRALQERFALVVDAFACTQADAESSAMRWMCGWDDECSDSLAPQAIVTVGLPPMDKAFRAQLRRWSVPHYHIGTEVHAWDMFGTPVNRWLIEPKAGLAELIDAAPDINAYAQAWSVRKSQLEVADYETHGNAWVDYEVYRWLAAQLPEASRIHFANSTSARYAQWFAWNGSTLHANRGVAGIDGCLSTAVGDALQNDSSRTVLIAGDAAWLYDVNGLHVNPRPKGLKVIVINNGGGNIFRWLKGPAESGLLEAHFEAGFAADVSASAQQLGLGYACATDWESLKNAFSAWLNNDALGLLEIQTPGEASAEYLLSKLATISEAMKRIQIPD
ncbi:MAG: 2-succinyl-5-enolpyruvyl-6-hydroxy-3-cyclohexene-1-carboxylic-acid synthase [Crocinitomicaceae bacterium]|nr:2-succinyl-5-enolpyruvyl-6-hydroxy-3-cyclohexene-1-carboxylic-acid synthase [Crocinitomicaceae bacterium]